MNLIHTANIWIIAQITVPAQTKLWYLHNNMKLEFGNVHLYKQNMFILIIKNK